MDTYEIKGHTIEYIDDIHCYLCDGIILPSVTTILKIKFGNKYKGIDETVLKRASEKLKDGFERGIYRRGGRGNL